MIAFLRHAQQEGYSKPTRRIHQLGRRARTRDVHTEMKAAATKAPPVMAFESVISILGRSISTTTTWPSRVSFYFWAGASV